MTSGYKDLVYNNISNILEFEERIKTLKFIRSVELDHYYHYKKILEELTTLEKPLAEGGRTVFIRMTSDQRKLMEIYGHHVKVLNRIIAEEKTDEQLYSNGSSTQEHKRKFIEYFWNKRFDPGYDTDGDLNGQAYVSDSDKEE